MVLFYLLFTIKLWLSGKSMDDFDGKNVVDPHWGEFYLL